MDTPEDDKLLGPIEGEPEKVLDSIADTSNDDNSAPIVETDPPTNIEQTNNDIINEYIQNKPLEIMADETKPLTPAAPETPATPEKKPKKKDDPTPVVVKKDNTLLIVAVVALLITVALFAWQNYKRRKKDAEEIIDTDHQQVNGEPGSNVTEYFTQDRPEGV